MQRPENLGSPFSNPNEKSGRRLPRLFAVGTALVVSAAGALYACSGGDGDESAGTPKSTSSTQGSEATVISTATVLPTSETQAPATTEPRIIIGSTTESSHGVGDGDTHVHRTGNSDTPLPTRSGTDGAAPYQFWMSGEMPTDKEFTCIVDLRGEDFANRASSARAIGGHAVLEHVWTPGRESQFSPTMSGDQPNLEIFAMSPDYADRFEGPNSYSFGDLSDTVTRVHAEQGTTIELFENSGFQGDSATVQC
jgi:hypothetical protein